MRSGSRPGPAQALPKPGAARHWWRSFLCSDYSPWGQLCVMHEWAYETKPTIFASKYKSCYYIISIIQDLYDFNYYTIFNLCDFNIVLFYIVTSILVSMILNHFQYVNIICKILYFQYSILIIYSNNVYFLMNCKSAWLNADPVDGGQMPERQGRLWETPCLRR